MVAAAFRGGGYIADETAIPINNWTNAGEKLGAGWPTMFVIIACGAVSGFHSLCAGGTTCKQLNNEPAARRVGYYGMLLESFLAVCVVCCLVVGLSLGDYKGFCYPVGAKGDANLTFAIAAPSRTRQFRTRHEVLPSSGHGPRHKLIVSMAYPGCSQHPILPWARGP